MSLVVQSPDSLVPTAPRRRSARKPAAPVESRRKVGVYLSQTAYRRLGACALLTGEDWSTIVDRLVCDQLSRFVVSERAKGADQPTPELSAN